MRSRFVLVVLGAAAVVGGYSYFFGDDVGADEITQAADPDRTDATSAGDKSDSSAADAAATEEQTAAFEELQQAVDARLGSGDPFAAARLLVEAGARGLSDVGLRRRAVQTADALAKRADAGSGKDATRARLEARQLYAMVYDSEDASERELDAAFDASRRLNRALLFGNGAPASLVFRHRVATGDRLWNLWNGPWKARGVRVTPGFVLFVNGISDARRIRAGASLRVPLEETTLLIRKSRYRLTVLLGGVPVEEFDVGIGADSSTPSGNFRISTMQKNPDWYYDGRRIPFGHPDHIIGTRWMGFTGAPEAEGIGIHGTTDETSIGKAVSMGCVRLRNADVERLFEWVPRGADVSVRD